MKVECCDCGEVFNLPDNLPEPWITWGSYLEWYNLGRYLTDKEAGKQVYMCQKCYSSKIWYAGVG